MTAPDGDTRRATQRWHLVAMLIVGLGLVAAPSIFQMFDRAPGGGEMLVDFRPYMDLETINGFRADLTVIGAARDEAHTAIAALPPEQHGQFPSVAAFERAWPGLNTDMRSMLDDMEHNIGNYRGVKALPPFALFPWFFVIPGVLIAALAGWTLFVDAGGRAAPRRRTAMVCLGVGLIAAPLVFQMFTRAPGGADMIDDFRPFMTDEKVAQVQGYFLSIGGGESELRRAVVPAVAAANGTSPESVLPAVQELNRDWPSIAAEMAPMVGTMADNVDRFAGIAALPPFWLFPWFFVIPGVVVAVLAWRSRDVVITPIPRRQLSLPLSQRDVGRAVAGITAIVVVVALAVVTIQSGTRRATTTTSRPAAAVGGAAQRDVAQGEPGSSRGGQPLQQAGPVGLSSPLPKDAPLPAPHEPNPQPAPTPSPDPSAPALSCPLPIPPAPGGGGVASVTPLVPLFGPFSPEAFAMLPAFAPLFQVMGPLMVAGQPWLVAAEPAISAVTPPARSLQSAGLSSLDPLYGPRRGDVLEAETGFAEQLGALMGSVVSIPGVGCIPAIEALLLSSGPSGPPAPSR